MFCFVLWYRLCLFLSHVSFTVVPLLDDSDNLVVAQSNYLNGNIRYCSIYSLFVLKKNVKDPITTVHTVFHISVIFNTCVNFKVTILFVRDFIVTIIDQVESLDEHTKFRIILTLKRKHETLPHNFVGVKNST